jgi:hypothetical protein
LWWNWRIQFVVPMPDMSELDVMLLRGGRMAEFLSRTLVTNKPIVSDQCDRQRLGTT